MAITTRLLQPAYGWLVARCSGRLLVQSKSIHVESGFTLINLDPVRRQKKKKLETLRVTTACRHRVFSMCEASRTHLLVEPNRHAIQRMVLIPLLLHGSWF